MTDWQSPETIALDYRTYPPLPPSLFSLRKCYGSRYNQGHQLRNRGICVRVTVRHRVLSAEFLADGIGS